MPQRESVYEIATRQHGLITRTQVHDVGIAPKTVTELLRASTWIPFTSRVLALPGIPNVRSRFLVGAQLHAVDGVISHGTALEVFGVAPASPDVNVTDLASDRHLDPKAPWLLVHRSDTIRPRDVVNRDGLRLTSPARCLADIASSTATARLARIADAILDRKLTTTAEIEDIVEHLSNRRWPGLKKLRRILDQLSTDALDASAISKRFLQLVRKADLPVPREEVPIRLASGDITYADFAWPAIGLVVELDGFTTHGRRSYFESDRSRSNEMLVLGLSTMRFTWRQLTTQPEAVIRQLRETFAARSSSFDPALVVAKTT